MRRFVSLITILAAASSLRAGDWEPVATELLQAEKPGYGGLSGVVVDPISGDLYIWLSDKGLYKSADQARTFKQVAAFKGRTEWPGCMQTSPDAPFKAWAIATVYGGPIILSTDGEQFTPLDKKSTHVDWVAVDWSHWSEPERMLLLTLKHESGGLLLVSSDGGKNFQEAGKGFGPAIIFDEKTAVAARNIAAGSKKSKQALARTADGGKSFELIAEFSAKAMPVWHDKKPYWLVDGALITSDDKGKTWQPIGPIKGGLFGPVFGKGDKHLFITTAAGIHESTDGGKTWAAPVAAPKSFKGINGMSWLGYDPINDILYLAKMGADLYRLKR